MIAGATAPVATFDVVRECGAKGEFPDTLLSVVAVDDAMALLLSLARKIPLANKHVHGGRWEMPLVQPLYRLRGRTLGLVAFGNIPQALVPKAKAFGLRVITTDPFVRVRIPVHSDHDARA